MAAVNSSLKHNVIWAFLCLLVSNGFVSVYAHSNESANQSPAVALADTAAEVVVSEGADGSLDGDLELGTANDAAMLQWAIGHVDPVKMRQMAAEARGWSHEELVAKNAELHQLLETVRPPSDFQLMEALLDVAANTSEPSGRRAAALEALQEVVEAIDNACDLHKTGGISTLVKLLADDDVNVRRGAAWVVGAAVQNNPEVQSQFLNTTCLPLLVAMVRSADSGEAAKALYAVSALVRDNAEGFRGFYQHGGPALLEKIVSSASADSRLQKKAVGLLGDLATFRGGRQAPGYESLSTSKVMRAMLGFMSAGDVDMREKVTRAVHALLADNAAALKSFSEKVRELEEVRNLEERLEEMSRGEDGARGAAGKEWQRYIKEMAEVIEQVEETVKVEEPLRLGPPKADRTKNEL